MSEHETTDFLQRRLAAFAKSMFLSFVVLRICEFVLYQVQPTIRPDRYWTIFTIGTASVFLLACLWLALAKLALSRRVLAAIDATVMTAAGIVFGAIAVLAWRHPESAYTCLVYASFMVFTRTIVVPSSGRRTAIVTAIAMAPLAAAAVYLPFITVEDKLPGAAFAAGGIMYTSVAVALAATGSHVIYGLRRRVSSLELELGQYKLVRKLGEGASGEVFVASHALLRRPTAIKLLAPARLGEGAIARCERAVREMSQLRHHNTVAVYDYGRSPDGVFYFAMEYLEGIGLDVLIERYDAQPPGRAIAILVQLCGALHEAHARGFAHGNIRASNVILCERGGLYDVAKLTDFGLANIAATPAGDLRALRDLATALCDDPAIAACFASATTARELATTLRALDRPWPATAARAWWSDFRRTSAPLLTAPTTLAVDLGGRAAG